MFLTQIYFHDIWHICIRPVVRFTSAKCHTFELNSCSVNAYYLLKQNEVSTLFCDVIWNHPNLKCRLAQWTSFTFLSDGNIC